MTEETGSPQASGEARLAELERQAEDIRQKLNQLVEQQRAGRVQMVLATVAILVIVLIFGVKLYGKMQSNFSKHRFQAILEERGPLLAEQARQALAQSAEELLPHFQELALARAREVGPQLMDRAEAELVSMPEEIGDDFEERLNNSLESVRLKTMQGLEEQFPFLADQAAAVEAAEDFKDQMLKQNPAIQDRLAKVMAEEQMRVRQLLSKFEVPDIDSIEKAELTKNVIKTALLYALYETEVSGTDEGNNEPVVPISQLKLE